MYTRFRFLVFLSGLQAASLAMAQAWPSLPIRLVVPFAAGGGTDIAARLIAPRLGEALGQPVVVENLAGGNAVIGSSAVAKASPDGYAFLMTTPSHAINPLVIAKLPYDTVRDFAPVSLFTMIPYVFAASNEVPAKNVKELIAYAKQNPGKLTYASSGPGSGARLTTELFNMVAGIQMLHVPYKSTAAGMPDMMAGRVSLIFDQEPMLMPLIRAGKIRGLAVTSTTRSPSAPELPTMSESGLANFAPVSWIAIFAPRGTPPVIVNRVSAEIRTALTSSPLKEKFQSIGTIPVGSTPEELAAFLKEDMDRWAKVAAQIKLQPE